MLETAYLQREHVEVLQKLDALEQGLKLAAIDEAKSYPLLSEAGKFLVANLGVHLDREEQGLFPLMEEHNAPQGPLSVMLVEHNQLRQDVNVIRRSLLALEDEEPLPKDLLPAARDLLEVLRGHITKEDQILFPLAERTVPHSALEELEQKWSSR